MICDDMSLDVVKQIKMRYDVIRCVGMRYDVMICHVMLYSEIRCDMMLLYIMIWYAMRWDEMRWNMIRYDMIWWDLIKLNKKNGNWAEQRLKIQNSGSRFSIDKQDKLKKHDFLVESYCIIITLSNIALHMPLRYISLLSCR